MFFQITSKAPFCFKLENNKKNPKDYHMKRVTQMTGQDEPL